MRSARFLLVASAACVLAGCARAPLYSALSEGQANEVQAALLSAHIDADKKPVPKSDLWSVSVSHDEIPQAMAVLNAAGLPRQLTLRARRVVKPDFRLFSRQMNRTRLNRA